MTTSETQPQMAGAEAEEPVAEALKRAEQALKAKRHNEATGICQDVLERAPDNPAAFAVLGAVHAQKGETDPAIELIERACARLGNVPSWHAMLANLYRQAYRLEEALAAARRAAQMEPTARSLLNLGIVHIDRGEMDEAATILLAALARDPDFPEGHLALGQILLARGEMGPGWIEYEWRNRTEQARGMLPKMGAPAWNGMAVPRGRLLLIADQGYGDALQFARYIPRVAPRCHSVLLACNAELAPVITRVPGVHGFYTRWQDIPGHAAQCLLSSLPGVFETRMETIPAEIPYLTVDPARVADWRARLAARLGNDRLRVGIFWAGRPTHPNDRRRTLRLSQLAPFAEIPGVALVSLQKDVPERDAGALRAMPGVLDLAPELTDFGETAAVVSNLHLLVTIDSAVAHLAGGLGAPVWMMLPRPCDFRWLHEGTHSPWYPTMRLFRQPAPGAWDPVIRAVSRELALAAARPEVMRPRLAAAQ